ncbi:MAG: hypothetical protein P4L46_20915 [Fimbriimonas sp.]|nr:hypothetical protein [Fimbriimonas sp.]
MQFPNLDPIPIPAPIWLMKVLSLLTLTLHFFAVQILIGSLVAVIYFSLKSKGQGASANQVAALAVARRLPIVMTFVINLGVPPLLFAQVLYGRALYTSSVLIACQWIAVVFLLMGCYWLLYRIADRTGLGKPSHWHALGALGLAAIVGHIYATNMTLMLRPEVWQAMYAKTATGFQMPPNDPTSEARVTFILVGGLLVGGFWLTLHSRLKTISDEAASVLRSTGSVFAVIGAIAELGVGYWAYSVQPSAVTDGLHSTFYQVSIGIWAIGYVLALLVAGLQVLKKATTALLSTIGGLGAFLGIAGAVIVRDGIRDATLKLKGWDIWLRIENSNWFVILLFVILFVAGLVAIGWLLSVMKAAKPITEKVNS